MARRKARSAAQRRNDKRLGQLARRRRTKPRRTKISKVVRKRRSPRRTPTKTVYRYRNPRKRRTTKRVARRRGGIIGTVGQVAPVALTSAVGALGLDVFMGYASQWIPANLATGPMGAVVKAGGAIVLGMLVERVTNKATAKQVMVGGLTVTIHEQLKMLMATNAPQIPLAGGELGWYSPARVAQGGSMNGMNPMGAYDMSSGRLGAYDMNTQASSAYTPD